jgi:uncharacterized protein YbjT (DUF2867 family)
MLKHHQSTVLLAGATGYLGMYIAKQLVKQNIHSKLIARKPEKLKTLSTTNVSVIKAEVTKPETLKHIMEGVHTVISTVGITRQIEGLTYMDVDYQANINLLNKAKKSGVKKFIYVSAINGNHMRHLKIFEAKEQFVDALKNSGLQYSIMRPNGFFSDMIDFQDMVKKGKVYLFGNGENKFNPIHGEDLAEVCIEAIQRKDKEIIIGGPDVLTQNEIAILAFKALNKPVKIKYLPDLIRRIIICMLRRFTSSKTYGPYEFFLTLMAQDNIAPRYGKHRLRDFFKHQNLQYNDRTK